ncbi:MAG: cation:proton antiporter [Thaumarchaeota archaeon]|nr:cation:proton antiporter [Nitrososphaerota archaeon]
MGSLEFEMIGWSIAKIVIFVAGTLAVGSLIVPRLIDKVAEIDRAEVLILSAVGLCFGLAIVGNRLGFSVAIGAFLMGVLVANARAVEKVAHLTSPLRDMFGAIFFVSVGALIDLSQFRVFLLPALIITLAMLAGKVIGCSLGTRIMGYDASTSLKVGLGMAQIGEFAFIVVRSGQAANAVSSFLYPTIGVAVAITAFLTPYMIKLSYKIR